MDKYFVICSVDDPGAECSTWEEAWEYARHLRTLEEKPTIVGPEMQYEESDHWYPPVEG